MTEHFSAIITLEKLKALYPRLSLYFVILFAFSVIFQPLMLSSISMDISQQIYAQQTPSTDPLSAPTLLSATTNMSTYDNSTYGIKVQYPSDWIYREQDRTNIVTFTPSSSLSSILNTIQSNTSSSLANQTNIFPIVTIGFEFLPFHNIPLNDYNNITINSLRQSPDFQLVMSGPTVLAGNPGNAIEYIQGLQSALITYTIIGNQLYTIAYLADSTQYSNFKPVAQQMINSLSINSTACIENFC